MRSKRPTTRSSSETTVVDAQAKALALLADLVGLHALEFDDLLLYEQFAQTAPEAAISFLEPLLSMLRYEATFLSEGPSLESSEFEHVERQAWMLYWAKRRGWRIEWARRTPEGLFDLHLTKDRSAIRAVASHESGEGQLLSQAANMFVRYWAEKFGQEALYRLLEHEKRHPLHTV